MGALVRSVNPEVSEKFTPGQACTAMLDALPRSWARRLQRNEALLAELPKVLT